MKLAELGEFGFIDRIRGRVRDGTDVVLGIGDDCAALRLPAGELLLTSTDLLIEEIHFRRAWTSLFDLGAKSAAVNLSDIAAMGGTPRFLYLGLGIPADLPLAELEALVDGFTQEAEDAGATLAGGDTCRSPGPLLIAVTVEGSVPPGELLRRGGARPGDGIYLSGTLGDSALALRQLQQGLPPEPFLLQRHRRPTARIGLGRALAAAGLATAMIDLSDGLLADLGHLLTASGVGAEISAATLPLSAPFRAAFAAAPELLELALAGGEDYELLFTVPPSREGELQTGTWPATVTRIGSVTPPECGLTVKGPDGAVLPMAHRGFNHFAPTGPAGPVAG